MTSSALAYCDPVERRERVVLGCGSGEVRIYDLASGALIRTLQGKNTAINGMTHYETVDERPRVVVGYSCGHVYIWDLESGELCQAVYHSHTVLTLHVVRSEADRSILIACLYGPRVYAYDLGEAPPIREMAVRPANKLG
jgi:WD40 repeat protein